MGKKSLIVLACAVALVVACCVTGAYWALRLRPVALASVREPAVRHDDSSRLTLVFTGDLMQHLPQVMAATRRDGSIDYTSCFSRLKNYFDGADFVIANLETTLGEEPYSGYPCFRSPVALARAMHAAGIDVAAMANNHVCDRGGDGIRSTIGAVRAAGMEYTGAFAGTAADPARHPLMLEKNGFRIALLNYTYGTNGIPVPRDCTVNLIDTLRMRRDIESARRAGATSVVLFIHWGNEYEYCPNIHQRSLADRAHRWGADLVIGSHPHVVQPVETVSDASGAICGVTAYSMGNFVSNQRQTGTDGGISVRVTLARHTDGRIAYAPAYLIHWTCIMADPFSRSGRRYDIVPSYARESIPAAHRGALDRFVARTREYMTKYSSGFNEIVHDY